MEEETTDYRIHITVRRKGESIFNSHEFKTEDQDDLLDLMASATEFVVVNIADDLEERDD